MRRVSFDSPFPMVWKSPYDGAVSLRIADDGTFTSDLPPGPYWAGYTPADKVRGGAQFEIIDRDVEDFKIEVAQAATLTGKAQYEDGSPVEPRLVQLSVFVPNMGIYERGFSVNASSTFFSPGMPAGTWHLESPGLVVRKVEIDGRSFQGNKFDLNPYSGPAVITFSKAGAGISGSVELHDRARAFPRGMVTIMPLPQHPTDIPLRKFLDGGTSFTADHLDPGRYRVCGWLEDGAEVNNLLGNPQYDQKLASLCETVVLGADEHTNIRVKQISAGDIR
jgi:hypothetical protein